MTRQSPPGNPGNATEPTTTPRRTSASRPRRPDGRSPLAALGRLLVRRRLTVVTAVLLAAAVAVPFAGSVAGRLSGGGFTDPAAESTRAEAFLANRFGTGPPHLVLLARAPGPVDAPGTERAGRDLVRRVLAQPGVLSAVSYWTAPQQAARQALKGRDGRSALVLVRLAGDTDRVHTTALDVVPRLTGHQGVLDVSATGPAQVGVEVQEHSQRDLLRAEAYALPLLLVILVLVFGSAVAAGLPLLIGGLSILGTFLVLRVVSAFTPVSVFSINITTALGLGLAVDYSLFLVTRYREEAARGLTTAEAVARSMRTAGRTVLFSALTVALSLSALLAFPLYFLRSFAYAGIAVVAFAAFSTLVVLPALLGLLGPRVDALDVRRLLRRRTRRTATAGPGGIASTLRAATVRRPVVCAAAVVGLLVVLGLPFARVSFGLADDRALPADASAHRTARFVREEFTARGSAALPVVLPEAGGRAREVGAYALRLSALPGVARVDAVTGSYAYGSRLAAASPASAAYTAGGATWLSVVTSVEPYSPRGTALVASLREQAAPGPALVGGDAAVLTDTRRAVTDGLPVAALIVGGATVVLLFLFTGSVLIPVKALLLNLLSLTAAFGAMVYVFQDGHLRFLVGDFTVTGTVDITMPVLMFCVAFGLSMDYEVFLLSRIREAYAQTGDNALAVGVGTAHTARLIGAASVLVAVPMAALATSGITFLKLLGVGLALAVLMDATLVRAVLVPAAMRLAGRANWWAPAPLRRLHDRLGCGDG
ncbi:MMPL family transporter [Streptomyces sp. cg36]|uniref:MMPL family transporter n=1 Tax=Streptomyces sp. cg36 TaxID=3238798 RepID=UPI0034E1B8E6